MSVKTAGGFASEGGLRLCPELVFRLGNVVFELRVLADKGQRDTAGCPRTVLADDEFGFATDLLVFRVVHVFPVDERDHVRVLFNGARLTQVGKLRAFVFTLFQSTVQLGNGDDGDFQVLGQSLESTGDFGDFLLAAAVLYWRRPGPAAGSQ